MLKNNLLGQILLGLLILMLLIGSLLLFFGGEIDEVEINPEDLTKLPAIPKPVGNNQNNDLNDSKSLIAGIIARPMFSDTRQPFVEEEVTDENDPTKENVVINEIKATVTGIVITPEQSYAMIVDSTTNQRMTYKVGMPLEGEQGGWTLNSIESRKVTFVSDDEKTAELELELFKGSVQAGKVAGKNRRNNKNAKGQNKKPPSRKDKKKNADDIRKKIAERRAQMRAEAAKKNKR